MLDEEEGHKGPERVEQGMNQGVGEVFSKNMFHGVHVGVSGRSGVIVVVVRSSSPLHQK